MTTLFPSEIRLSGDNLLAALASGLLLFVSVGVVYLSSVEWRDRRRRAREARGRRS